MGAGASRAGLETPSKHIPFYAERHAPFSGRSIAKLATGVPCKADLRPQIGKPGGSRKSGFRAKHVKVVLANTDARARGMRMTGRTHSHFYNSLRYLSRARNPRSSCRNFRRTAACRMHIALQGVPLQRPADFTNARAALPGAYLAFSPLSFVSLFVIFAFSVSFSPLRPFFCPTPPVKQNHGEEQTGSSA